MLFVEVFLVKAAPFPVEELDSLAEAQLYIAQTEGLHAALLKDKVIEDLTRNNASLQTTVYTQAATIQKQATYIEKLKKTQKSQRRTIVFLVIAFILLTLMVFAYLIIHDAPTQTMASYHLYFPEKRRICRAIGAVDKAVITHLKNTKSRRVRESLPYHGGFLYLI